jgi:hypothetical protein
MTGLFHRPCNTRPGRARLEDGFVVGGDMYEHVEVVVTDEVVVQHQLQQGLVGFAPLSDGWTLIKQASLFGPD